MPKTPYNTCCDTLQNNSLFDWWENFLKLALQKGSNIKNLQSLHKIRNRILLFFNRIFSQKYLAYNTQYTAVRTFYENNFYPTDGRPFQKLAVRINNQYFSNMKLYFAMKLLCSLLFLLKLLLYFLQKYSWHMYRHLNIVKNLALLFS